LGGRKGIRPVKTEWGAGVVVYLEQGADNSMIYEQSFTHKMAAKANWRRNYVTVTVRDFLFQIISFKKYISFP